LRGRESRQERLPASRRSCRVLEHRQRPAPASELTRDRDVRDDGALLALGEPQPPLVQALVAGSEEMDTCISEIFHNADDAARVVSDAVALAAATPR